MILHKLLQHPTTTAKVTSDLAGKKGSCQQSRSDKLCYSVKYTKYSPKVQTVHSCQTTKDENCVYKPELATQMELISTQRHSVHCKNKFQIRPENNIQYFH